MKKTLYTTGHWLGLQEHLGALFIVSMVLAGLILSMIGYRMVDNVADTSIREKLDDLSHIIKTEMLTIRQPIQPTLNSLANGVFPSLQTLDERLSYLPLTMSMFDSYRIINGIMIGYDNGEFFMVRRLTNGDRIRPFQAPAGSAFVVMSVTRNASSTSPQHEYIFYGNDQELIERRTVKREQDYDPRTRQWYQAAMATDKQVAVDPFVHSSELPILLFSEKSHDGTAVIGIDIALEQISSMLERELPTANSRLALLRPNGILIGSARGMLTGTEDNLRIRTVHDLSPVLNQLSIAYLAGLRGHDLDITIGQQRWKASIEESKHQGVAIDAFILAIPWEDLQATNQAFLRFALIGILGILLFSLPVIWLVSRRISAPLRAMAKKTQRFIEFTEGESETKLSSVKEIADLMQGIDQMQQNQEKILSLIRMIDSRRDFESLLQHMLREIVDMAQADGGCLVMINGSKNNPDRGWYYWTGSEVKPVTIPGNLPKEQFSTYRALNEKRTIHEHISRNDPRTQMSMIAQGFDDPSTQWLDIVCVPMLDHMRESLGAMTLFKYGHPESTAFSDRQVNFIETLVATASAILETQKLLKSQSNMRDAFIHILAGAIDAKSPYTGGHCARVPIIFQMILEAACNEQEGPLKHFELDENGWEEARLAGWLHDCGKVTTPEYVMDKATKLETLYDRIHEIRTRFEVLKRDAQNTYLCALLNGEDPIEAKQNLDAELSALDDDFAFVASCNAGSEHMSNEALERLTIIGQRTWKRTLDKRLGVSSDELARINGSCEAELPVMEKLLMDCPEHIIPRGEKDKLSEQNDWGFKLNPPEALYNRGELYNLSIRRGTLTEEERYKINDHITRTIIMLGTIPLPKHLRNMPEIAGAHHETIDGQGYPRGLKRNQMSWPARMMAVADIFEALTACDRPYKTSKTLTETLKIMEGFVERKHIDPDVFELFIRSGIPQRYAKEYLKPEQNDL